MPSQKFPCDIRDAAVFAVHGGVHLSHFNIRYPARQL
jgi:hypothetical protein